MKPGISCFGQVNGRNESSFEKRMELDKRYIDQWSLCFNFKILFKIILVVLRDSGGL